VVGDASLVKVARVAWTSSHPPKLAGSTPAPFSLQYEYNHHGRNKSAPLRHPILGLAFLSQQTTGSCSLTSKSTKGTDKVSVMSADTVTAGGEPAVQLTFRTFTVSPLDPGSFVIPGADSGSPASQTVSGYGFVVTRRHDWAPNSSQIRDLERWTPSQSELSEDKYRHWRPTSDHVQRRGVKMGISDLMMPIMSVRTLLHVDWDVTRPLAIQSDKADSIFQEVSGGN
jgi:hypothetical protein